MSDIVRKFKATLPCPPRKKKVVQQAVGDAQSDVVADKKVNNRQWATGWKLAFLLSYIEVFKEASELEQISNLYDNVTITWIAMWWWDLPVETAAPPQPQEPSEADSLSPPRSQQRRLSIVGFTSGGFTGCIDTVLMWCAFN